VPAISNQERTPYHHFGYSTVCSKKTKFYFAVFSNNFEIACEITPKLQSSCGTHLQLHLLLVSSGFDKTLVVTFEICLPSYPICDTLRKNLEHVFQKTLG